MRVLIAVLLALLVVLQYRLWFGAGGLNEVRHLREEITHQRNENELLGERNRTLVAEVQDLKQGTAAIEERARTDLGMVGAGETFYQVITKLSREPAVAGDETSPNADKDRGGR
jgi:cell division protein FtsB